RRLPLDRTFSRANPPTTEASRAAGGGPATDLSGKPRGDRDRRLDDSGHGSRHELRAPRELSALRVRGESTEGRVASAAGAAPRRRPGGEAAGHRRGTATTEMRPRRRNPEGARVLRAIAVLLGLDDPLRDRLRPRALRSHHNTCARGLLYFRHG